MDWTVPVSPFLLHFLPFLLPFPPPVWVRVSGGDRGGLICMLVEKWGLGSLGGGQVGYRRGGGGAKPRPPLHLLHTHTKQKIWIHQNLLGHGCSNSPQAERFGLQQQRPGHIPLVSPRLPDHVTSSARAAFCVSVLVHV